MEIHVRTRLSLGELRRFGWTVGGAFGALTLLVVWRRGLTTPALALAFVAVSLLTFGTLLPAALAPVERAWMAFARALSRITTPIVLSVLYFVVVTPIGLLRRAFRGRALRRTVGDPRLIAGGYWIPRPDGQRRSDLRRQF